jgi:hypothetical protein
VGEEGLLLPKGAGVEEETAGPFDDPVVEVGLEGFAVEVGAVGGAGEGEGLGEGGKVSFGETKETGEKQYLDVLQPSMPRKERSPLLLVGVEAVCDILESTSVLLLPSGKGRLISLRLPR